MTPNMPTTSSRQEAECTSGWRSSPISSATDSRTTDRNTTERTITKKEKTKGSKKHCSSMGKEAFEQYKNEGNS